MKKDKTLTRIVVIMLVLTMLALIAIAGTYAKYTTSASGKGTAIIGKWDINLKQDKNNLATTDFEIDLASTMTTSDSQNAFIQPGSSGQFVITVENAGLVDATVTAALDTESSSSLFSKGQFTIEASGGATGGNGVTVVAGSTSDVTITWSWTYDQSTDADIEDTGLGENTTGTAQDICAITLTATQVNPNP